MGLSGKTIEEVSRFTAQPPLHPSHWNSVWVAVAFDLFVEPQTRAWYSIQPWPRDRHSMDLRRTPALTIVRNNIDLHAISSSGASDGGSTSNDASALPHPVSDMQGVVLIDYLNSSSWGDADALRELEERVQGQTAHALSIRPGEYGYAIDTVYFIMAVGPRWRFGVRDAHGFRYLSDWYDLVRDVSTELAFDKLVDMVEKI